MAARERKYVIPRRAGTLTLEADEGETPYFKAGPHADGHSTSITVGGRLLMDGIELSDRSRNTRQHLTVRVTAGALEHAVFQAQQETQQSGKRWTRSDVLRAWFVMGRAAWLKGERP